MLRRSVLTVIAVALCAVIALPVASAAVGALPDQTAAVSGKKKKKTRYCGKVNIGFTDARVKAKRVKCKKAKNIFREWRKAAERACVNGVCPALAIRAYTCAKSDSNFLIRVKCANGKGKFLRAQWGD